jgi:DNA topoisomerase IB
VPRLRRADCAAPGIRRVRRGRGFSYIDDTTGEPVTEADTLDRIRDLAIPPAWLDVWICPWPNGHLQAVGTDARGRKQYRYHDHWRELRDRAKFDRMLEFGKALPHLREETDRHLRRRGPTRERVLAGAVRLLDRGFFRIGSENYAEENDTYGLATMQKRHVRLEPGNMLVFDYPAKGGQRRMESIVDPQVYRLVSELKRRRGGGPDLLAYKVHGRWRDVVSSEVNAYIKEAAGEDFTAKDFRTWTATVLAAVGVAVSGRAAASASARKRAVARTVQEVAHYLGNTPAVCRASYIDPRVFDHYAAGVTVADALEGLGDVDFGEPATQGAVEAAVIELLSVHEPPVLARAA